MPTRAGQFQLQMPDGLVIERLPVGLANGAWRMTFVASGIDFLAGDPPRAVDFAREFRARVAIEGVGGPLASLGSSGGGSEREQVVTLSYSCDGAAELRVSYSYDGDVLATEHIDLRVS